MPGMRMSASTRSIGWPATIASASLASRAETTAWPTRCEDALERTAIQLLVVDDEDIGFALQG